MSHRFLAIAVTALIGLPASALAQSKPAAFEISLAQGAPVERQGREQLQRILSELDLSRWLFTRSVRIDARAIPHSHPVLTVNTRYLTNDTAQVATFVHEQLHWFLVRQRIATDSAIADLEQLYPDAPDGPPEGARDRYSTYLHLIVCALEYDAVRLLFGDDVARRTLGGWRHYPWVYRQVLENPDPIWNVLRRHGLDSPDARL